MADKGGNGGGLVKPDGSPMVKEPRLIVIKQPKGVQIHPNVVAQIAKMTGCDIVVLPMDSELMMGKLALEELKSVHQGVHAILQLGPIEEK